MRWSALEGFLGASGPGPGPAPRSPSLSESDTNSCASSAGSSGITAGVAGVCSGESGWREFLAEARFTALSVSGPGRRKGGGSVGRTGWAVEAGGVSGDLSLA